MPKLRSQAVGVKKLTDPAILVRRINRELCAKRGLPAGSNPADPLEFLIRLASGEWPKDILDFYVAGAKDDPGKYPVPIKVRQDAAETLLPYMHPRLTATEVSGPDGGPIPLAATVVDVSEMLRIPEMAKQLQTLSLKMSDMRRQKLIEARATIDTTAEVILDAETVSEDEEEEPNGHPFDQRPVADHPGEDSE